MAHWLFITNQADGTAKSSQSAGDQVLANLLDGTDAASSRADTITWRSHSTAEQANDETNFNGVLISETVSSGTLGTKYKNYTIPVICAEGAAWDSLAFTTGNATGAAEQTAYLEDGTHHIAAGLTDDTVHTLATTGSKYNIEATAIGSGATLVWKRSSGSSQWNTFVFETGATKADSVAAEARRVAFGWLDTACAAFNANGKSLFLACVEWALGEDAGGGQTLDLTGSLGFSTAITKQSQRPIAVALSLASAVAKQAQRPITASLNLAAALVKSAAKPVTGSLTLSATLARQAQRPIPATLALAGASAVRAVSRSIESSLSLAEALVKTTQRTVTASIGLAGGAIEALRVIQLALSGVLALSAGSIKRIERTIAVTLALSSVAARSASKHVAGTLAVAGGLARSSLRGFAASLALAAASAKQVQRVTTAALSMTAGLARSSARAFAVAMSLAGSLASSVIPAGGTVALLLLRRYRLHRR